MHKTQEPAVQVSSIPSFEGRGRVGASKARLQVIGRKVFIVLAIIAAWQVYVSVSNTNDLLVPTPWQVVTALADGFASSTLSSAVTKTMSDLVLSMVIAMGLSIVLVTISLMGKLGDELLSVLTAMINPLPSIAILPLVILWVGITREALIIVTVNSIIWPMTLNIVAGFRAVPPTILMVGENLKLSRLRLVSDVYLPSALPYVIAGIKTGWAFAWRTIIAVELIFGSTGGAVGLGTFINDARTYLKTDSVFAGLVTIAIIGIIFESLFKLFERKTIVRWGMSTQ